MVNMIQLQLGKNGLTPEFLANLKLAAKNVENIRIAVLKSACRDRDGLREIADKIIGGLGTKFTARIIGYTIILKKWRKARKSAGFS